MIRHALASDAQAIAHIQNASWRATYRGIIAERTLHNLSDSRSTAGWLHWFFNRPTDSLCLVVTADDASARPARVLGYAMARPAPGPGRDPGPIGEAEIQVLYLHPGHVRQGLGRELIGATARGLQRLGFRSLQVWSLADNPSRPFYRRLGGTAIQTRQTQVGGQSLNEICYHWPSLHELADRQAA